MEKENQPINENDSTAPPAKVKKLMPVDLYTKPRLKKCKECGVSAKSNNSKVCTNGHPFTRKKKPPIECVPAGMTQVTDVRHNWETNSHTLHQHHSLHSVTLFGKKTKNGYQFSHFSTPGFGNSILNNQFGDAIKNVFEEQFMDAYPLQKKTQPSTTTEPDALASTTTEPDALASTTTEPDALASATTEPDALASTTTEPDALASTITEPDALASTTSTTEKDFYSVEEVLTMTDNS